MWNEAKVDQEIMLLRKARQMTKQSYQNRIKNGGSLLKKAKQQYVHGGGYCDNSINLTDLNPIAGVITD